MNRISTRTSGLAATAAVHVALGALLLAGWQVSRTIKPPPGPMIIIDRPAPNPTPADPARVTSTDIPITVPIEAPLWTQDADPVVQAAPVTADPGPPTLAGGEGEPVVTGPPPVMAGPSRIARLRGGDALQPPYPSASRAMDEEGSVVLTVSIDAAGRVTGVSLLRSSGFARLDSAALEFARRRWRFEPALQDGRPMASTRNITVRFSLDADR